MGSEDIIAIIAIVLMVGGALAYIIKAKKSGKKCIGCPDCSSCKSEKCGGSCHLCACKCSSKNENDTKDGSNNS